MTNPKPKEFREAYILSTFKHFQEVWSTPLLRGQILRKALQTQAALGRPTEHYRMKLLRESAQKIVTTMNTIIVDHNRSHPEDELSLNDCLDVLDVCRLKYTL